MWPTRRRFSPPPTGSRTSSGPIDVWVNVAFTSVFAPFDQINPDEYRRVTEVSYLGYVYGTMAALQQMKPRDRGTIVQVGSALAYRGIPLQTAYCGAKHAIQGFHEALRCELLHEKSNVHVTMVQMPAVNTPQFSWVLSRLPHHAQPVPPIYQPEVAARGVLYAADHPQRREYWVGASTAATLAANAIAPGLLDRYLGKTGFASQQTKQPHDPGRAGEPVGAGRRTRRQGLRRARHLRRQGQHHRDPQLWASHHHGLLAAAARGVPAGAAAAGCWAAGGDRARPSAACASARIWACRHGRGRCCDPGPPRPPWPGWSAATGPPRTPPWSGCSVGGNCCRAPRVLDPARTSTGASAALAVDVLHAASMVAAALIWPRLPPGGADQRRGRRRLRRCRCS